MKYDWAPYLVEQWKIWKYPWLKHLRVYFLDITEKPVESFIWNKFWSCIGSLEGTILGSSLGNAVGEEQIFSVGYKNCCTVEKNLVLEMGKKLVWKLEQEKGMLFVVDFLFGWMIVEVEERITGGDKTE